MARINFKKNKLVKIVSIVLAGLVLVGVIGGIVSMTKQKTETISSWAFDVGTLDEDGIYQPSDQDLYTKESFGCRGLRVEPDFTYKGTYDVYYYDYDERLIEVKADLTGVYDEDYPLAKMARIVIHPDVPEGENRNEFKIDFWEKNSFASMLKVTVDKDQKNYYGNATNLYFNENAQMGKTFDANGYDSTVTIADDVNAKVSEEIAITGEYEFYDVYVRTSAKADVHTISVIVASSDNEVLTRQAYSYEDMAAGEWCKLTLEVPDVEEGMYLLVRMDVDAECRIYGYND